MSGSSRAKGSGDELVREIYRAAAGTGSLSEALRMLAVETSSDQAFWGRFDLGLSTGEIVDSYNADPSFIRNYNGGRGAQNVWLRKGRHFKAEGGVWAGSRIVPMRELTHSEFYEHMLAPWGIYHTLHLVVAVEGETVVHIILTRGPSDPDYGTREIAVARSFARHARSALEIQRALAPKRTVQSILSELVDDAGLGVVVFNGSLVIYASYNCQAMFNSPDLDSARDRVPFRHSNPFGTPLYLPRDLADAVARYDGFGPTTTVIKQAIGKRRYIAQIKPLPFCDPSHIERRIALALVIYDPDRHSSINEELLEAVYKLTKSEAHICSLLVNGHAVDDIAVDLDISPHTVRTHLQRIYQKTGSTRQMDVVKLLLNTATRRRNGDLSHADAQNGHRTFRARQVRRLENSPLGRTHSQDHRRKPIQGDDH